MPKIEVTHIIPKLGYGGTEKAVEIIVNNASADVNSTILVLDQKGVRGERLSNNGVDVRLADTNKKVRIYLRTESIDVLHIHSDFRRGRKILKMADDSSIPVIIKSLHFGKSNDSEYQHIIDSYIHIGKMILLRYMILNNLSEVQNDWRKKHKCIYNPIDLSEIDSNADPIYREQFNIPDDAPVIGKIGRAAPEKWGKILIDAYQIIRKTHPETHLLLANTPEKIQNSLQRKNLKNVHYVQEIPLGEIDKFHNSIDILTHSSAIGECTPYVFLEAMATKTPIVVNSQPMRDNGQIEIVDHGSTGYVANTPTTYANATIKLIESPKLRETMGKKGFEKVSQNHSAEFIVRQIESLYALNLIKNKTCNKYQPNDIEGFEDNINLDAFLKEYQKRLIKHYGDPGIKYKTELLSWKVISSLPFARKFTYELARKAFLFFDEYI